MASIVAVGARWRAQVRRSGSKSISRTFATRKEAEAWARATEHAADRGRRFGGRQATIERLLAHYEAARADAGRPVGKQSNEHYMLARLKGHFGAMQLQKLATAEIRDYCRIRRRQGAGPYTVNMEISKLGTGLRYACSLLEIPYQDAVGAARPTLHHLGLIGAGEKRTRRPTPDEWTRLLAYLPTLPTALPMADMLRVAALNAFRRGELCRIAWPDLDVARRTIIVRDRKHPRRKKGNDEVVPLVGDSLDIIMRQPRREREPRIFPYEPSTLSFWFTRACKHLEIEDLHFHDMRHEATSALFEAGWQIPEVAAVTGHKDWRQLKRYTHPDPAEIAKKPR